MTLYIVHRKLCVASMLLLASGFVAGCGSSPFISTASAPVMVSGAALKGTSYGGQQPVVGAAIKLYAAATSGYGGATANLLNTTVVTDAGGSFTVPAGAYSCTAGQMLYLVASGGNPGGGANPNLALMAALGDCAAPSTYPFININEVTTVSSVFALAPFMTGIAAVGTTSTNTSGLAHAFASVRKLVNLATGLAPGSGLPSDAVAPAKEIYSLSDALATCINSTGGSAGDGTNCGYFFNLATPPSGSAPTDTIQAVLNIAHYPTQNVPALFNLSSPSAPFNPQLTSAPNDWTLAVTYKASGSLNAPKSTTVDAAGNIWVANSGNNSVTVLAQSGVPLPASPFTGNGLAVPSAVAIDVGGKGWIANSNGSTVSVFTPLGGVFGGSPFGGSGTISSPVSIAIDAPGNVWIANSGSSTITELTSAGAYIDSAGSQGTVSNPTSLAIDPK